MLLWLIMFLKGGGRLCIQVYINILKHYFYLGFLLLSLMVISSLFIFPFFLFPTKFETTWLAAFIPRFLRKYLF